VQADGTFPKPRLMAVTDYKVFPVGAQETSPRGMAFSSDGTQMYIVGNITDTVYQYALGTAWNVKTATLSQSFNVNAQAGFPEGVTFSTDGTNMYVIGSNSGDNINQYSLSTAWSVSTASYVREFSVSAQETGPRDVTFSPDGTNMYVIGSSGDGVDQYSLSTAWDISTASFVRFQSFSGFDTLPEGVFFKSDGTKMWILGQTNRTVYQFTLSTAWNIATANPDGSFSVSSSAFSPSALFFKSDGTEMYVVSVSYDAVFTYPLATAWSVATASFNTPTQNWFSVQAQESLAEGLTFSTDGTNMYVVGTTGDDINQYSLSTPWQVSSASFLRTRSISAQETIPTGITFSPDGLNLYIMGDSGNDVNQYSLSTAWDVSTTSFVRVFSVSGQELTPQDLYFSPDGLKMYVMGISGDDVNEYTLSTAWNISTASFVQTFSVAAQQTLPHGLYFKPDGTQMYVSGPATMNQYTLSTPWNVSTASLAVTIPISQYLYGNSLLF
jgi:DNA-binding beta-propeller fold protein YncE